MNYHDAFLSYKITIISNNYSILVGVIMHYISILVYYNYSLLIALASFCVRGHGYPGTIFKIPGTIYKIPGAIYCILY